MDGLAFRRAFAYIVLAAAVPLLASAQAQNLRDRDPDLSGAKKLAADLQQATYRSGPFYLLSRFRLSDLGYTETAYLPTGDQGEQLSLSVEAPQRLYFVPHKKTIFSVDVVPAYDFFDQAGDRGQVDYLVRADAHLLLNHLYLDVYGVQADQLRAHVADVNRLATTLDKEVGVSGEAKYSSRTSTIFTVRQRDTSYPQDRYQPVSVRDGSLLVIPLDLLDRTEKNARVSFLHKTLPMTSFFVAGEGSDYTFDRATYKDAQRRWYGGGFLYDTGRTILRLEAGPAKLDFEDPAQRDYSNVIGGVRASRTNHRWSYFATADRDVGFSIFKNNNYYIADSGSIGVAYSATRRLQLRANVAAEQDNYDVPIDGHDRRDTMSFSTVGFVYALRRLVFGLDTGWYDRESTFGGDEDSGIRFVVHLSLTL